MIQIRKINGNDSQLYPLIGPLVMNKDVLRYNQGYPFKTSEKYVWYIATEEENVVGFIPLECRTSEHIINNYYAQTEGHDLILSTLLDALLDDEAQQKNTLSAVVQTIHRELFTQRKFHITKEWKIYLKMQKD